MITVNELYEQSRALLRDNGASNPGLSARRVLKHFLDVSDMQILTGSDMEITDERAAEIRAALDRHIQGEPISRIAGTREFWGIPFIVTPDVLDPRPDTEIIIDVALKRLSSEPPYRVLDLGTGTGCIIIALLTEFLGATGIASDISEDALDIARRNAENAGVEDRLEFVKANWGDSIDETFDLIVSNPPYIPNPDITNLPQEVRNYDPILALAGGEDGLDCYRILITKIKSALNPGGIALFEVGFNQAADVSRLVEESGLSVMGVHPDMAGIPRVVEISTGEK